MIAIVGGGLFVGGAPILVLEAASCDETDHEEDHQYRPPQQHLLGPACLSTQKQEEMRIPAANDSSVERNKSLASWTVIIR